MTSPARTIDVDTPIPVAAKAPSDATVRRFFVLAQGKIAGVLSRRDVLDVFLRPDSEVRDDVDNEVFEREFRAEPGTYSVTAHNGVVTLLGTTSAIISAGSLTDQVPGSSR